MSDRLKKLIEEQNQLWTRMQDIKRAGAEREDDPGLTAEEATNWDAAEERLVKVSGDIERLERDAKREAVDHTQAVAVNDDTDVDQREENHDVAYRGAFETYVRRGMTGVTREQQQLLMANQAEVRAQGVATGAAGGFFVPTEFRNSVAETMKEYGGLLNLATVINTSGGGTLQWPTNDDTGNVGAILAENTQITEQDVTLGQRSLGAYVYTSKLVRVSLQLLEDSAFDINTWLPRKLGERIGRAIAAHLVAGTGTAQPEGLVTNLAIGKTGAVGQTTSITYDDLVDLEHSIDPAYRPNARYVMSDAALKMVRKLKDTQGRPLWVPVPAPGFPSTINGFPYSVDNGMAVPAANAKSIIFGDIGHAFLVRQVHGVQMVRLAERYADFLQVGFFGFARLDAKPDDPSAARAYAHSAT